MCRKERELRSNQTKRYRARVDEKTEGAAPKFKFIVSYCHKFRVRERRKTRVKF